MVGCSALQFARQAAEAEWMRDSAAALEAENERLRARAELAEARLAALNLPDELYFRRHEEAVASFHGEGQLRWSGRSHNIELHDASGDDAATIYPLLDRLRAQALGCTVDELPERAAAHDATQPAGVGQVPGDFSGGDCT
jgi:hypothetical protein